MNDIPFVAIGNDELGKCKPLGKTVSCNRCGKRHKVRYGESVLKDDTKVPSKLLAYVKCNGSLYLIGIDGKKLP